MTVDSDRTSSSSSPPKRISSPLEVTVSPQGEEHVQEMELVDVSDHDESESHLMTPLMANTASTTVGTESSTTPTETTTTTIHTTPTAPTTLFRSRKKKSFEESGKRPRSRRGGVVNGPLAAAKNVFRFWGLLSSNGCCQNKGCCIFSKDKQKEVCRSITAAMNVLARIVFWISMVALVACVIWYSYELKNNGTDPHLIAWFSAGAFVLLGFPISMYGIVMHLANYNQPNVQCYIVRILWMVPIYSMESWLCLRFHQFAIYIETLRDCYEAYVLYNFLQFLIQVLGGEEELVLMLKDKSPTRGVHMWGLQWCVRPWLMGQPVSRTSILKKKLQANTNNNNNNSANNNTNNRSVKRVQWTSPFFVKCKFGVLQYVLLKVVSSIFVMVLELHGLYKEGDFTPKGGYLYICILTNTSQCWALYCLIFFYFATKNELGPIRPVGKFLSVKALVFFTWWQSVMISMLYQAGMIPHYQKDGDAEWTSEAVAKGLQDYLICIEMFIGAIVHTFVFPHSDYLEEAVAARSAANRHLSPRHLKKRLGRRGRTLWSYSKDDKSYCSKSSGNYNTSEYDLEMNSSVGGGLSIRQQEDASGDDPLRHESETLMALNERDEKEHVAVVSHSFSADYSVESSVSTHRNDDNDNDEEEDRFINDVKQEEFLYAPTPQQLQQQQQQASNPGFVRALLDSTIPTDVMDNTVGIVKGDYHVEKKTLLHHAATYDQYDLFSSSGKSRRLPRPSSRNPTTTNVPPVRKLSQDKSEKEQQ